ncbi:uncharacterized protein LOC125034927 [Penaeus chinensis]|uniref:uncharacterized protein LOC125034927 n=1 Tax=Penaeus chinensis TaxID=139456 RepID=UPI001FB72E1F|nr:uncharacterized protein LOC125034927 [Penaeus chinensis]
MFLRPVALTKQRLTKRKVLRVRYIAVATPSLGTVQPLAPRRPSLAFAPTAMMPRFSLMLALGELGGERGAPWCFGDVPLWEPSKPTRCSARPLLPPQDTRTAPRTSGPTPLPSTSRNRTPIAALAANIPGGGVPGEDYPILASVPDTGFSCEDQEFPGYYADTAPEAGCQVFHICQFDGHHDAFLCPNGTIFNQQYFVCDWWFNVDCAASVQFRSLNADIGKIPEDAAASVRNDVVAPNQLYGTPEERQAHPPTPSQSYGRPNRF